MNKMKFIIWLPLLIIGSIIFWDKVAFAENIDPDNDGSQYAWGENVGWINFEPSQGPGVTVSDTAISGYAWGENIGWINFVPAGKGIKTSWQKCTDNDNDGYAVEGGSCGPVDCNDNNSSINPGANELCDGKD